MMNKRAEEFWKVVYKQKAGDNFIAARKTGMTLLMNNYQYIWGYRWRDTQTLNIGELVYIIEKPRLVRHW